MNFGWMLLTAFTSVLGEVKSEELVRSLELMGKGMLGILVVMLLIFVVIVLLNKIKPRKKEEK